MYLCSNNSDLYYEGITLEKCSTGWVNELTYSRHFKYLLLIFFKLIITYLADVNMKMRNCFQ